MRRLRLLRRRAVDDVPGPGTVVADAACDELLADLAGLAWSLLLVLVDVAGRDDLIAFLRNTQLEAGAGDVWAAFSF